MRSGEAKRAMAWTLVLMTICLTSAVTTVAQDRKKGANKDGKDDIVGTRWHYVITHDNRKETGLFRVHKKEVFRNARKVGDVNPHSPDHTTLIINGLPELNGRAELRKVDTRPPVWRGTLIRPNGSKWAMEVEIKDR